MADKLDVTKLEAVLLDSKRDVVDNDVVKKTVKLVLVKRLQKLKMIYLILLV